MRRIRRAKADVVRVSAARLHERERRPHLRAQSAVHRRAERDGRVEAPGRQHPRRRAEPTAERVHDAFSRNRRSEESAVEQHDVGPDHAAIAHGLDVRRRRWRRAREKAGEVAGDGRIAFERKAKLAQPATTVSVCGDAVAGGDRQEVVDDLLDISA